eukprot:scaffold78917_cov33-Tisochrysis_lutea.AAC.7
MQSGDMYLWQSFGTDDPQANADPKKPQRTDARKVQLRSHRWRLMMEWKHRARMSAYPPCAPQLGGSGHGP